MNYVKRGIKAFDLLKNNLRLYLPDITFLLIIFIISIMFLKITGLYDVAMSQQLNQINSIIQSNLTNIAFLTLFFILLIFLISIQISSMKLSLIKDIIQNKKINLKKSFDEGLEYYTKVLSLKLLVFLILLIPLIIVIILNLLIKVTIITVVLMLLLIITWLILTILLFYRFPVLFLSKIKQPISVLKESYRKVSKNIGYTIITILVIIAIYIIVMIISGILNLFVTGNTIIDSAITIIKVLINLTAALISLIYVFLSFKDLPS